MSEKKNDNKSAALSHQRSVQQVKSDHTPRGPGYPGPPVMTGLHSARSSKRLSNDMGLQAHMKVTDSDSGAKTTRAAIIYYSIANLIYYVLRV